MPRRYTVEEQPPRVGLCSFQHRFPDASGLGRPDAGFEIFEQRDGQVPGSKDA